MKEYIIKENSDKELSFSFLFDKTSTIFSVLFSLILFGIIFLNMTFWVLKSIWIYLIILFCLLFYMTFNKYFEWKKNRFSKLFLDNEDVLINDVFYAKKQQIKSVNIIYNLNKFESGWTIYLKRHVESQNYIVKKRLKEEDAHIIANKIAIFLDKQIFID